MPSTPRNNLAGQKRICIQLICVCSKSEIILPVNSSKAAASGQGEKHEVEAPPLFDAYVSHRCLPAYPSTDTICDLPPSLVLDRSKA
eukprot:6187270-Pleurochrysis_carterae.AAC.1